MLICSGVFDLFIKKSNGSHKDDDEDEDEEIDNEIEDDDDLEERVFPHDDDGK